MNKSKQIFEILNLNDDGLFKIIHPQCDGLFKLTNLLYIKKYNGSIFESTQFQLCDLLNGTLEIKSVCTIKG